MAWQDAVISIGSVVFIISLFPSILGKDKPAMATSIMTGVVLSTFVAVHISLQFWFSAATTAIVALLWFVLAAQMAKRRRK